jgi:hypothetical protein
MLAECHKKVSELCRSIAQHMIDIKESVYRMSQVHAYNCLQGILQRKDDGVLWVANPELRAQLDEARHAPDSIIPTLCTWCQSTTHNIQDCSVFTQCTYCENYGQFSNACHYLHH